MLFSLLLLLPFSYSEPGGMEGQGLADWGSCRKAEARRRTPKLLEEVQSFKALRSDSSMGGLPCARNRCGDLLSSCM